jgi:hypothetical protein
LRDIERERWLPERSVCEALLREMVSEKILALKALERPMGEADALQRSRMFDRLSILQDEKQARLHLRYEAEARTSFHRAYKDLVTTLERDALAGDEAITRNEPTSGAVAATPEGPSLAECVSEILASEGISFPAPLVEEVLGGGSLAEAMQGISDSHSPSHGGNEEETPTPPEVTPTPRNEPDAAHQAATLPDELDSRPVATRSPIEPSPDVSAVKMVSRNEPTPKAGRSIETIRETTGSVAGPGASDAAPDGALPGGGPLREVVGPALSGFGASPGHSRFISAHDH